MNEKNIALKAEVVSKIGAVMDASQSFVVVEYRGLSVAKLTELRRSIAKQGGTLTVYKNGLVSRAAKERGLDGSHGVMIPVQNVDNLQLSDEIVDAVRNNLFHIYAISTIEMIAKRESIQGKVRFDERFGLGTKFLTCGEEEIWMHDALKAGLKINYFPKKIIETSTLLKKSHIYVDAGVQRSRGAITYYIYGKKAWWHCFSFALKSARNGMCHFIPMFKHLAEGIRYMQRTKA